MILNNVDLNKLKIFHAVMEKGSYRLASDELGLTKSAISQAITTLESQLGLSLFLRKSRKIIPTESAQLLFDEYSNYQFSLGQTLQKLGNPKSQVEGSVKIGAHLDFAKTKLVPLMQDFFKSYPHIQLNLQFHSPSHLQSLLERGRLDMVFSVFPVKGVKSIESTKIFRQELVLVANRPIKSLDDLLAQPIIDYFPSHQVIKRWIYCHFGKRPQKLPTRVFAGTAEMVIELVKAGLGVGVVPKNIFDSNKESSRIHLIRPTEKQLVDFIWLSQFKNQFSNSAHEVFYNTIKERF